MGSEKDSLGNRMKLYYENRSKTYLTRRTPVIIRLDGCNFKSFTAGFDKPFDKMLMEAMQETTIELCKSIQGCVLGYTQSDEITLVLVDYNELNSQAWCDYNVHKVCSISASMATMYFNRIFKRKVREFVNEFYKPMTDSKTYGEESVKRLQNLLASYNRSIEHGGVFDSRCFNIPAEEVLNCILWRIKDCNRNSINSLGQSYFPHDELQGKNASEIQDMLMEKFGINWNNLSNFEKGGTLILRGENGFEIKDACIKSYADLEKFSEDNELDVFF